MGVTTILPSQMHICIKRLYSNARPADVYFVVEYLVGSDLMLYIQLKQLSLRQANFCESEVILAL
jgi:hypothetical protein